MKTKVLITGVTGMVGSHLVDFLLKNTDWDVYGICRWRSVNSDTSEPLARKNRASLTVFLSHPF